MSEVWQASGLNRSAQLLRRLWLWLALPGAGSLALLALGGWLDLTGVVIGALPLALGGLTAFAAHSPRTASIVQSAPLHADPLTTALNRPDDDIAALVDALLDPVLIVDQRRLVVQANAEAAKLFDRDLRGRSIEVVLRDPGVLAAIDKAISERLSGSLALNIVGHVPRSFAVRVTALAMPGLGGRFAVIALREQTEAIAIEQMRADFVANASHELRTPLTAIRGFIETLQGPARDDVAARGEFLAIMASEAERMARLIDDLLSLSRIEMEGRQRPNTVVPALPLIERAIASLTSFAAVNEVTLVCDLPQRLAKIRAHEDRLQQVVSNLIDNGIKYGGRGKTVTVRAAEHVKAPPGAGPLIGRPAVAITVEDQGEGIPPEAIPRLTERFYRVDRGRARRLGGTGLGLAIVKHTLRQHQGHLHIESELGVGSRFTVYLPVAL